jgi:glutathione synthase/RimK-type ligase-like ATP-grasp enzyme
MPAVTLATCAQLPTGDEDGLLLTEALSALGVDWQWAAWNDPSVDWSVAGLVVVRSTWDYTADREVFLGWADRLGRVENPPAVLRWNSDKIYLRDLADAGVPIVPTAWVAPGQALGLPLGEVVVKPSVGAGSMGAGRFDTRRPGVVESARRHAQALLDAGRVVLVQPYVADVDQYGETALIYVDGAFSHAIGKAAMLSGDTANNVDVGLSGALFLSERITTRVPSDDELAVGAQVLDVLRRRFGRDVLYTRVDLLPGSAGPAVVEVELVEPSLFIAFDTGSADRIAAAIARRIG